jgi:hypothetical protein
VVTHLATGKKYYGAKYSKNSHPSTFFKNYFTSSKIVRMYLEAEGLSAFSFEIRKTFLSAQDCINWEKKVLTRLKVNENDKWLNIDTYQKIKNNSNTIFIHNENTQECIRINNQLPIPEGWKKGNLTFRNKKVKYDNRKWFYDPVTLESFHLSLNKVSDNLIPGRTPNYVSNSETLKGKYKWVNNNIISKLIPVSEPCPENWCLGRVKKQKSEKIKVEKIKETRSFKFISNGVETKKLFEDEIKPENFSYIAKQTPHLFPKPPSIFINNGKITKKHYSMLPIPNGWKKGYASKTSRKSKMCRLSLFKNKITNELKLFSINFKNDDWEKFNQSKFSSNKKAPLKGRIGIYHKETKKIKYIYPSEKIPDGYVLKKLLCKN